MILPIPRILAVAVFRCGAAIVVPAAIGAQATVLLQVRPHVGDTIRLGIDQEMEMSGARKVKGVDSAVTTTTTVRIRSHAVVVRSDSSGATVDATADSVSATSSDAHESASHTETAKRLLGRTVRLRFSPDGGTEVSAGDPAAQELFAQMPATLPKDAVAVGSTWTRELHLPSVRSDEDRVMRATFRLDSLTHGGQFAHISMKGTVSGSRAYEKRGVLTHDGTVAGMLVLDRRRGWLSDARSTVNVKSVLAWEGGGMPPTAMRMKVTQWVRVLDNK